MRRPRRTRPPPRPPSTACEVAARSTERTGRSPGLRPDPPTAPRPRGPAVEPLQLRLATLGEPDAVDPSSEVDDLPAREHLAGARERAEPSGDVQGAAPVAALDRHSLAGVEPDPHSERKGWIGDRLLDEPLLQGHRSADRRARRTEDDQRLVTAELEHTARGDPRPPSGSPRRSAPRGVRRPRPRVPA